MSDEADIVVTGTRLRRSDDGGGLWDLHFWSVYVPANLANPFEQYGGNANPELVHFELINGDVIVRISEYNFLIKIPAADWTRMNDRERGDFIKMITEYRDSPMLVETLNNLQAEGAGQVVIRYDHVIHQANGNTLLWPPDTAGRMSAEYNTNPDGTLNTNDIKPGSTVIININPNLVPSSSGTYPTEMLPDGRLVMITFAWVVAHDFGTPSIPALLLQRRIKSSLMQKRWSIKYSIRLTPPKGRLRTT